MVVTPLPTPVKTPVAGSMVPAATLVLLHAPPVTGSVRFMDWPVHTVDGPRMAVGIAVTVTTVVV